MNRSGTLPWPGWEIVRRLGSGSYGSVFEIEREQFGIHERAALKVISFPKDPGELEEWRQSGYDDQTLAQSYRRQMERVLNEYKLLMELKGTSHIVNCDTYEVIAHPDGIGWDIYIRMELLTPLKKYLAREITPEQTVKLGLDLCKALSLCREKDIIHRDIKPDNILVSDSGDFKLGDFGVAKTAERTMAGTRTGTPNFTAPEVYHNEPYGKSVDIYSLGMVLYWMLNRRALPFLPLPPQMPSPDEMQEALLRRMRGEALPRPVDGSRALQDVVLKACAYRPEDRYATPEELRRALKAVRAADTSAADTIPDVQPAAPAAEPSSTDADATMGNNWETGPQTETQPELTDFDATDATMGTCGTLPNQYGNDASRQKDSEPIHRPQFETSPSAQSQRTKGDDKLVHVTLTAEQAANGCQIDVRGGRRSAKLRVTVPKHTVNGQMFRLYGEGHNSRDGGEPGDLLIQFHVPKLVSAATPGRFESDVFQDYGAAITADVSELTLCPGESATILLTRSGNVPEPCCYWWRKQSDITLEFGQQLDNRNILATVTGKKPSEGYVRFYIGSDAETFKDAALYAFVDVHVDVRSAHTHGSGTSAPDSAEVRYDEESERELKHGYVTLSGTLSRSALQRARQCMREHGTNDLRIYTSGTLSREIMMQIGSISNLDRLTIYGADDNTRMEDFTPLTSLRVLSKLRLPNVHLRDISPLADMPQLSSLSLDKNEIVDLRPLSGLKRLTDLDISENRVSDLTPLSGLTKMRCLFLSSNRISDLWPLAGMTELMSLWIRCNRVSDLTPLSGMKELSYLTISYNQIYDLTPLAGMTEMEMLWMRNNPISDLTPLSAMTVLDLVDVSATNVKSLKGLENARALDTLYVADCNLTDISALNVSGCREALKRDYD